VAQDYVVLKAPGVKAREVLAGTRSVPSATPIREVKVERRTLSAKEVAETRKESDSLAVAPRMPVRLVKPVQAAADGPAAGAADTGDVTWGIQAMSVLTSPFTGKGVSVAVLDTGIQADHEAFAGREIVQKDFTGEGDGDQNGHGTHCAGTIFGGTVGGVRIGIAPGIERAFIGKVLDRNGSGSTDQIMDAIIWAARQGANVISMSLGLDFPGLVKQFIDDGMEVEPATSLALAEYRENVRLFDTLAALVAAQSEMFSKAMIVAAAGNESDRPRYEVATAPPAAADGILSVGALAKGAGTTFTVARFSNAQPDIAGPGVDVRSAKLGGGLRALNGTSMATPHVVGVAALWLERIKKANPAFKISELEGRLVGNASQQGIAEGADRANVGAGLALAPQN
jgi:subtilisin family serine protease